MATGTISFKEKRVIRKFLRRGYIAIPHTSASVLNSVKIGIKSNKLNTKLSYLVSNVAIGGNIYLLPKGFWFSYYDMEIENNGYIYEALSKYAVPGYTKAYIPEGSSK